MTHEELMAEVQIEMAKQQDDSSIIASDEKPVVVKHVVVVKQAVAVDAPVAKAAAAQEESMLEQMLTQQKEKSPVRGGSIYQEKMKPKKSLRKSKPKTAVKTTRDSKYTRSFAPEVTDNTTVVYKNQAVCSSPTLRAEPGRLGSPIRYRQGQKAFDDDVNRGLAREMYID